MANNKEVIVMFQCLTRPMLLMGGERESILFVGIFCLVLAGVGGELWITAIAVVLYVVGIFVCRLLAQHDPNMTKIFIRSVRYEGFYPATERMVTPAIKPEKLTLTRFHT